MSLKWQAVYNNDSVLEQYNEDGTENKYSDIDRNRLSEFRLFGELGEFVFSLEIDDPRKRLIFRRRNFISSNPNEEDSKKVVYLVGWQMTVGDENIQSISYIHERGFPVIVGGRFREGHALYGPVVPLDIET